MSGLDKFFKGPPKPQKKINPKMPKKPAKPEAPQQKKQAKEFEDLNENESLAEPAEPSRTDQPDAQRHSGEKSGLRLRESDEIPESGAILPPSRKYVKYQLKCSNKKCNYSRILMKANLTPADLICPKCKTEMRHPQLLNSKIIKL